MSTQHDHLPAPHDGPSAVPASGSNKPVRRRSAKAPLGAALLQDELSVARRIKAQQRTKVARYVDSRLDAMECDEVYTVPMLYVAVTGSLAPAHLLKIVEHWSEQAYADTGSGWVRRSVQDWVNHSGLAEPDWVAARDALRERGLIEERRRYDFGSEEIITEICFAPSVFASEVAKVREAIRDDAWGLVRQGQDL
jgi:hypothetical protein